MICTHVLWLKRLPRGGCDWRDYQEEDIIGEEFKLFLLNQTNKFSISPLSNPPNQIQIREN